MGKTRKKVADSDAPARDAVSLWKIFSRERRLYPKTHDKKFVDDLREALRVPNGEEITDFLKRVRPDTTTFMLAVLNALEPLGRMLSDIYSMFVRHGLKESDDRLLIEFDFGEALGKLRFDATHFRATLQTLLQVRLSLDAHQFTGKDLRAICFEIGGALADANNQPPTRHPRDRILGISAQGDPIRLSSIPESESLQRWLEPKDDARAPGFFWPYATSPPLPDLSTPDPVHEALRPLIMAMGDLCLISRRYPTYQAFEKAAGAIRDPGVETRAQVASWSLGATRLYQSDGLALLILRLLWHCDRLAPLDMRSRQDLAQRIVEAIARHSSLAVIQPPIQALEDLLDLPLWDHREKIYCIWLITVIEGAFRDGEFVMRGDEGRLVFVFGKTLVARISAPGAEMDLISEMRTPAGKVKLIGKHRTDNIQPDYIMQYRDDSRMGRVAYVLEAKQYEKASLKNFSEALYDYAAVHKESQVSLVNYGPMSKSIYMAVAAIVAKLKVADLAHRCSAFGNVEPTFPDNIRAVREHIREAIKTKEVFSPTLIVDVSESISQVLPDEQRTHQLELWHALSSSRMPMIFAAQGFVHAYAGDSHRDVLQLIRSHLQSSALALEEIEAIRRKGAVLLTDESGFTESAGFYHELAAVIVLRGPNAATIHVNPHFHAQIEHQFSGLLKSTIIAELPLG